MVHKESEDDVDDDVKSEGDEEVAPISSCFIAAKQTEFWKMEALPFLGTKSSGSLLWEMKPVQDCISDVHFSQIPHIQILQLNIEGGFGAYRL